MARRIGILSPSSIKVASCSGVVKLVIEESPMKGISMCCSSGVDEHRHGLLPHFPIPIYSADNMVIFDEGDEVDRTRKFDIC